MTTITCDRCNKKLTEDLQSWDDPDYCSDCVRSVIRSESTLLEALTTVVNGMGWQEEERRSDQCDPLARVALEAIAQAQTSRIPSPNAS